MKMSYSYPLCSIMLFAGSAIAQGPNVGRIDRWSLWRPTCVEPRWFLLCGATDPPTEISISDRRTRDALGDKNGRFLKGVSRDLVNMEDAVGSNLFNTVKDLYLTKSEALAKIGHFFEACKAKKCHPMLYYTGHGEIGTGNWCFHDGTISIEEIFDMVPGGVYYPMIFSDACYSGHWADFCINKGISGFHCLAACPKYSMAFDSAGGGELTQFMTGKKQRPRTEPMYSGGNFNDYPTSRGYDSVNYTDFIKSNIVNSEKILITQTIHDGRFSACFGTSKLYSPRPTCCWWIRPNYDTFLKDVKEDWEWVNGKSLQIYSLACDEKFGFGVFLMENFGTAQTILTGTSDIKEEWADGFYITACAARGSSFYIIMTKNTKEYTGKAQKWFTRNTWQGVASEIGTGYKEGKGVTGICYSTGLGQYFVVMTEMPEGQSYRWFEKTTKQGHAARREWVEKKYKEDLYPTIIFIDPRDDKLLIVMTGDKNRSGYSFLINFPLK